MQRHFTGLQPLLLFPEGDPGHVVAGSFHRLKHQACRVDRGERLLVGHDHLVPVGRVNEVEEDSLFLHQAAGEVVVALAILNAVHAGLIVPPDLEIYVGDGGQNLLQDLGDRQVLENPALKVLRQPPEVGHDLHVIKREALPAQALGQARTDAVEEPRSPVRLPEAGRDRASQERIEIDRCLIGRGQRQVEVEEPGDRLEPRKRRDQEHVVAQRRRDLQRPRGLRVLARAGGAIDRALRRLGHKTCVPLAINASRSWTHRALSIMKPPMASIVYTSRGSPSSASARGNVSTINDRSSQTAASTEAD